MWSLVLLLCLAAERGPVAVRVVGPVGDALPGIGVADAEGKLLGKTDAKGVLKLTDVPYDGTLKVGIKDDRLPPRLRITPDGMVPIDKHVRVVGPELVLHAKAGVYCEIVFVDAEDGKEIPDIAWGIDTEPAPGRRRLVFVGPGESGPLRVGKLPHRYVLWDRRGAVGAMSLFAKSMRAVVPLRRVVNLELTILTHDGKPCELGEIVGYEFAGRKKKYHSEVDEKGVAELLGIPYFRGERITVHVREYTDNEAIRRATWSRKLWATYGSLMKGEVRLPRETEPWEDDDPFPGGNTAIGVAGERPPPPTEFGSVYVHAMRHDGKTPAARASLVLRHSSDRNRNRYTQLDERGQATLKRIGVGKWTLEVSGPGILQSSRRVVVKPGSHEPVHLVEPIPGNADVRVFDGKGKRLPYARLQLFMPREKYWWGRSWDVTDGVQRVDPFTDAKGFRAMAHLPPGALGFRATYGGRTGETVAIIHSKNRTSVHIVIH